MAVDFIKSPTPEQSVKPAKIDFWKPDFGPVPMVDSFGKVQQSLDAALPIPEFVGESVASTLNDFEVQHKKRGRPKKEQ